jgi:hypothetical protein
LNAANGYNLSNVAIFGHSHGGGAVYQLGEAIFSTSAEKWPMNFKVRLTGYVDAIEQDGWLGGNIDTDSEIRRPFSLFHVNYYQTIPYVYLLRGAPTVLNPAEPVPSVANYDVTNPKYDHSSIANDRGVKDGLIAFTELLIER